MRSNSSLPSRISSRTNDSKDRSSETIEIFHETAATHHHSRTKQRRRIRSGKKKGEMFSLRTFIKGIHWHPRIPFRVHFVSLCPYKNENHLVPLHVIITHAHHSTIEYIANTTPTKSIHKSNERLRFSFNFFSLVLEASRQSHGQSTVSPYSLSECVVVRSKGKQRRHR